MLHGNLHPGKLYLNAAQQVRICDLSHACEVQTVGNDDPNPPTRAIHGVDVLGDRSAKRRRYLAPEVLYGCANLGPHAEQFALGVIFLEAINGRLASDGEVIDQHDYQRQVDLQDFLDGVAKRSSQLEDMLRRMTHVNANRRYSTLQDALNALARVPGARGRRSGRSKPPSESAKPPPKSPAESPRQPGKAPTIRAPGLAQADRGRLVEILTEQAQANPAGASVFFERLLANAKLPAGWTEDHTQSFRLIPAVAARLLVDWAISKKEHPHEPQFTVLGSLLHSLLPKLGFSDARYIVALISHYGLYQSLELQSLELRYLVPRLADDPTGETVNLGPDITWCGPPDDTVNFHSFMPSPPSLFDVGFLHRALEQSAAICRIELADRHRRGTGFLIAPRLVLTCYHVLKDGPADDLVQNAHSTLVRFGCFTDAQGNEAKGQVFSLADPPVVRESRKEELDYLLLRVADPIKDAKDLRQVAWVDSAPVVKQALNILQHPEGDVMKLALCTSGVTGIDPSNGRVQYVTSAKGGSSGSPCFNDSWQVVAMHHAQRARAFGSIREGILFGKILAEIKDCLG
jgi:V8-like Glu-specific endopeptidase